MEITEFEKQFGYLTEMLTPEEVEELIATGSVAVSVGDKRVFTLRLVAEESEIPEQDFSKAEIGKWHKPT